MIDLTTGADGIAEARFDAPGEKVNILGEATMARLVEVLDSLESEVTAGTVRGVVFTSAKKGVFLAGADVKAFVGIAEAGDARAAADKARQGQALFSRIAALPVPTVAAINGACLGGGLELALACTARVAGDAASVSLGLPEIRLGLVPGWGGTQRLPRLVGPSRALDLILTGRSLPGRKAKKIGLVDWVAPIEGIDHAGRREARRLADGGRIRRPKWSALDRFGVTRVLVYHLARRRVRRQTGGHYPAPPAAIDAVAFGFSRPIEEGLAFEAKRLGELLVGDVSRNLVRIFLSSRAASSTDAAASEAVEVSRLGVIGAGTMGGGIAAVAAMSGVSVRLRDVDAAALARGMVQVHARAVEAIRKGRLSRPEAQQREALVAPTVDASGFSRCDLVIEAVVEDLEIKRKVLAEIESLTGPRAIFATNTSSLSVAGIAEGARRPGRVLGLHFFNPVHKMPLVEIVRGPATEDDAVETARRLARRMGKTPVVVEDTPGFIVNRVLMPYLAGSIGLLGEGVTIKEVDEGMVRFGMPMGPFALLDRIGLDVAAKVADVLEAAFGPGDGGGAPAFLHAMVDAGLLGLKAGRGFYRYRAGKPTGPTPDLPTPPAGSGRRRSDGRSAPEIAEILVDAMINEAARLLQERAVEKPEVIDLAMVFGTGFPPFRGGLLRHADTIGCRAVADRLEARGIEPAPLLRQTGRFYP